MRRTLTISALAAGALLLAGAALAQFQARQGTAEWEGRALSMADLSREPQISKVAVVNLATADGNEALGKLAATLPDALAAYLTANGFAQAAPRAQQAYKLEEYGLPAFESREAVTAFADGLQTDSMLCGDVASVGGVTRIRLVLAETDEGTFYPPVNIYCPDPNDTQAVSDMACRAIRSLLKSEDLTEELKSTWQEPAAGQLRFAAQPNLTRVRAGEPTTLFVRFEFAAGEFQTNQRSPLNVAIVLDRSGSMEGDKIEQAKQAAIRTVQGLNADDRISFVIYDDVIETPVPCTACTDPDQIIKTIQEITARNTTNLGGGLQEGYRQARTVADSTLVSRVILISDGLANEGETRSEVLAQWAREQYEEDLPTSTVGIGTDYNKELMEAIAIAGNGGYYYVQTPESINDTIAREFSSLFATVAEGSRLALRLMPGAKLERIFGYEPTEAAGAFTVDVPTLRSRDRKYLIAQLSVPALEAGPHEIAQVRVDYQDALANGRPASVETTATVEATANPTAEDVNWDVQLDAEELASAETMQRIVKLLDQGDRDSAIGLIQHRIADLARLSMQTKNLRSQVQCNILDGLAALVEQGQDADGLQYAVLNAQSIAYGGLAGNFNYQGLGALRGAAAAAPAAAGGAFGGTRQQ